MDYMLYRLCGVCATDHTMASGTMMYDIISRRWAAEMIDELGLDIEKLPEILEAGAPIGTVRPEIAAALGLRRDVTVGVGGQDQKCAALGAGLDRNMASASLGTGCCISALYMKPCLDPYRRIPCFAYLNDAQWVLEGVLNTAGACYEWFRNNFAPQYTFAELNKLACETSGPAREMFFPYLAGGSSPRWGSPTGTFTGLSLYSNLGNMARSVLEGVAYGICENLRVINSLGANIESLKLFGGGANSPLWCQIIADITGLPVRTLITGETALAGAALLALRAVSRYDVPPVKEFKEYIPDKSSVRQYQEAFEQRESFTENLHLIPRAQSAR